MRINTVTDNAYTFWKSDQHKTQWVGNLPETPTASQQLSSLLSAQPNLAYILFFSESKFPTKAEGWQRYTLICAYLRISKGISLYFLIYLQDLQRNLHDKLKIKHDNRESYPYSTWSFASPSMWPRESEVVVIPSFLSVGFCLPSGPRVANWYLGQPKKKKRRVFSS